MTEKRTVGKKPRAIIAAAILATGIAGTGAAAWLVGSRVSTWNELYSWYNPAAGFHSAALPVGFEDLVDRIKPTVVGVRAKVEQDADEEERACVFGIRLDPGVRAQVGQELAEGLEGFHGPH